jgi:hypothetical protein
VTIFTAGEITASKIAVCDALRTAVVEFDRMEVQEILYTGKVQLEIKGKLSDGTIFAGADTIRIINKGCGKR